MLRGKWLGRSPFYRRFGRRLVVCDAIVSDKAVICGCVKTREGPPDVCVCWRNVVVNIVARCKDEISTYTFAGCLFLAELYGLRVKCECNRTVTQLLRGLTSR